MLLWMAQQWMGSGILNISLCSAIINGQLSDVFRIKKFYDPLPVCFIVPIIPERCLYVDGTLFYPLPKYPSGGGDTYYDQHIEQENNYHVPVATPSETSKARGIHRPTSLANTLEGELIPRASFAPSNKLLARLFTLIEQENNYHVPVATPSETSKAQREAARKLFPVPPMML